MAAVSMGQYLGGNDALYRKILPSENSNTVAIGNYIFLIANNSEAISAIFKLFYFHRITMDKHIVPKDALAGGNEGISANKSAPSGIIISALEVIEICLSGTILDASAKMMAFYLP
jgi:hypothetical protein